MPTQVYGSFQTQLGIAREVTPGTGVAPTRFLAANAPKPKDNIKFLQDKAYRGLPVVEFGRYPLSGVSEVDFDGPLYPDDPAILLMGAVGYPYEIVAPSATTVAGGSGTVGATTLTVTSGTGYQIGSAIIIESGVAGKQESNIALNVVSNTITLLTPLRFAHANGAAVSSNVLHNFTAISPYFGTNDTSGATTTFTATSATDAAKNWAINQWVGHVVTAGAVTGTVLSNTATVLTIAAWSGATPSGNTVFTIAALSAGSYIQPPSFSIYDFYGDSQRQFANSYISDLSIKWNVENDVTYQAKTMGALSAVTSQAASASYTTVPPLVGWQGGFAQTASGSGGSVTVQNNLLDLQLDFKRSVTPVYGAYGIQSPTALFPGPVAISGKATLQMQGETEYNHFRNSDHPKMQFGIYGPVGYPSGSPTATGMLFTLDNPTYTVLTVERGKEFVEVSIQFEAAHNSTDNGPGLVQVTNALANYNT